MDRKEKMKKVILFTLVLFLMFSMTFAAFQAPTAGDAFAGAARVCPTVGWNASALCMAKAPAESIQSIAFYAPLVPITPNVGWNS